LIFIIIVFYIEENDETRSSIRSSKKNKDRVRAKLICQVERVCREKKKLNKARIVVPFESTPEKLTNENQM
jgi:hypothetical protein